MIYENFKLSRKSLRYKQRDIAQKLGIGRAYISAIERGVKTPSKLLIKAYCGILDVNEEWLLTGKGDMLKKKMAKPSYIDIITKVQELDTLKEKGSITDSEFHLLKTNLLAPLKADT